MRDRHHRTSLCTPDIFAATYEPEPDEGYADLTFARPEMPVPEGKA